MSGTRAHSSDEAGLVVGGVAAAAFAACLIVWVPIRLTSPPGYDGSNNPMATTLALVQGQVTWTTACTIIAAALGTVLLGAAVLIVWAGNRRGSHTKKIEHQSRHLAAGRELTRLTPKGVAASAAKLRPGLDSDDPDEHGAPIGIHIPSGVFLRETWEDMSVDIWGPRKGKTTARAIPKIVACPGPVVVTSRKGDIVDATRGPRSKRGRCWVFDPMSMLDQPQGFWWNPLGTVATVTDARRLADAFCHRDANATRDAFFSDESDDLVANFILAAAVSGRDLRQVYRWSTRQRDDEPVGLLRDAGFAEAAEAVQGVIDLADKTRGGIYGGAKASLRCLTEAATLAWITPQPGLPEFDPVAFPASTDTLYLVSEDGPGAPAPVIAAFVDTVWRSGEAAARRSPGRRLDPPMATIADEAANVVKLAIIPQIMSFYGSAGLPVDIILQSFSQAVRVWGREGAQAMWSAANIRILGGGVSDPEFLRSVAEQIGEFDEPTTSTSKSWGSSRSTSVSYRRRQILSPADLTALPDGRMLLLPSGSRPALLRSQGWWDGPYAEAIHASLAQWDPAAQSEEARQTWSEGRAVTETDHRWTTSLFGRSQER